MVAEEVAMWAAVETSHGATAGSVEDKHKRARLHVLMASNVGIGLSVLEAMSRLLSVSLRTPCDVQVGQDGLIE